MFYENIFPFARKYDEQVEKERSKVFGPPPSDNDITNMFTEIPDGSPEEGRPQVGGTGFPGSIATDQEGHGSAEQTHEETSR